MCQSLKWEMEASVSSMWHSKVQGLPKVQGKSKFTVVMNIQHNQYSYYAVTHALTSIR